VIAVRRPSTSGEERGAIVLTLALIVLISAVYCLWLSPTYDKTIYEEKMVTGFIVEPYGVSTQTFDAEEGRELEVTIGVDLIAVPGVEPRTLDFSVSIYGPAGELILSRSDVNRISHKIEVEEGGVYRVEVENPHGEALSLTLRIVDRSTRKIRPLKPLGVWLTLISLPMLGLGTWLIYVGPARKAYAGKGPA
jgi:hypothetical protein